MDGDDEIGLATQVLLLDYARSADERRHSDDTTASADGDVDLGETL